MRCRKQPAGGLRRHRHGARGRCYELRIPLLSPQDIDEKELSICDYICVPGRDCHPDTVPWRLATLLYRVVGPTLHGHGPLKVVVI